MPMTMSSQPVTGGVRVNGRSPWVWALHRALMGIAILAISIGGAAWLLYAAIDPDVEASGEAAATLRNTTIVEAPLPARPAMRPLGAIAAQ